MGKTIKIGIVNQKGGVGKTTTAVNLASILAHKHGKRVLLVDMDPQGHATAHMGFDPDELMGVGDIFIGGETLKGVTEATKVSGLDLVPSPEDDTDMRIQPLPAREFFLKRALAQADEYDFVIIDAPPHLSVLMFNVLAACDHYLITIYPEGASVRGISKLERTAQTLRDTFHPELSLLGVVACRVDTRLRLTKAVLDALGGEETLHVFETRIRQNVKLSEAFTMGEPVILSEPGSNGAKDYMALTREILEKLNAT